MFLYSPLNSALRGPVRNEGDVAVRRGLISVEEAKKIVVENVTALHVVTSPLEKAAGYVLAEDVYSELDIPAFNQSSVDGYAFAFADVHQGLVIQGEMAAGTKENFRLLPKHAIRIFTGAAIPDMADTVVMQEKTIIENGRLVIRDEQLQQGGNFRPKGSEIKEGAPALLKDNFLSPASIGFLAGIGIANVSVYAKPSISVIVTGNELQTPGIPLRFGQVYESNSLTLKAALEQLHFADVKIFRVTDDLSLLSKTLSEALQSSDVIMLTGGVSVGDYDFVLQAATDCGVEKLFHKVKQRPGKPLYFGKRENKLVFGLPGNPSSVLTCFYEYVVPALEIMTKQKALIKIARVALARDYKKLKELTFFLKGFFDGHKAMPLDAQESYRLSSYAKANCLIRLEENVQEYQEGEMVEIHVLPH